MSPDVTPEADLKAERMLVLGMGAYAFGRERRAVRMLGRMGRIDPYFLISKWEDGNVSALLSRNEFEYGTAPFGYLGRARVDWTLVTLLHLPLLLLRTLTAYFKRRCGTVLILDLGAFLNALPSILLLKAFARTRLVFYLGDTPSDRAVNRLMGRLIDRTADGIVVNSGSVKCGLAKIGVREELIDVVYNGVDLEHYGAAVHDTPSVGVTTISSAAARAEDTPTVRATNLTFAATDDPSTIMADDSANTGTDDATTTGADDESLLIGFVGQFTKTKGVGDFLDAAALIASADPRCRFVLVGGVNLDDPFQRHLPARIEEAGLADRVKITGWIEDVAPVYARMDILVVPSRHEDPAPNTNLEAMASGVPIVATRVGGTPELVADGETAYLVDRASPEQIADRVLTLAADADERRRMGRSGRARAERYFNADKNAADVQCILMGAPNSTGARQAMSTPQAMGAPHASPDPRTANAGPMREGTSRTLRHPQTAAEA